MHWKPFYTNDCYYCKRNGWKNFSILYKIILFVAEGLFQNEFINSLHADSKNEHSFLLNPCHCFVRRWAPIDQTLLRCQCSVWFLTLTAVHITHSVLLMPPSHMMYLIVYLLRQLAKAPGRRPWNLLPTAAREIMNSECNVPSKQNKTNGP